MTNLYYVWTTAKEHRGFKDVHITWFMASPRVKPVAPYEELISDYAALGKNRSEVEGLVDEMFTEDEAQALLAWLNKHRPAVHELRPETMPIRGRSEDGAINVGVSYIPLGGLQDCIVPNEADWDLPFKVLGYYDLRFHEQVDGTPAMYA